MLVWGSYNYSYSYLAHFQAPALYIHNYDIYYDYTGLLLTSGLLVCSCIDKSMQIVLE